jgi:hypothetical protein
MGVKIDLQFLSYTNQMLAWKICLTMTRLVSILKRVHLLHYKSNYINAYFHVFNLKLFLEYLWKFLKPWVCFNL